MEYISRFSPTLCDHALSALYRAQGCHTLWAVSFSHNHSTMRRCFTYHLIKYYFVYTEWQDRKNCHDILMCIIHHFTTTNPPCLNNPTGQLHLCVNTRLGGDSPHMATDNLWKSLELSSKLCSSQFGQICFMPLSYYSSRDVRTKHVSWQEPSVWSLRFPVQETRLMEQIR